MPVPFLNPATGQLEIYADQDLTPENVQALAGRGLRQATPEDIANRERTLEYGTTAQQALAQAERVVRGATLGQVEGFSGTDEEIRARAEVSEEMSPVTSLAADLVPDVGLGLLTGGVSALATTGGRIAAKGAVKAGARAALGAAAKAAPGATLAGESVAGGLVTAAQQAYGEGRQFFREDPVTDATNAIMWAGIGGVLGGAPMAFRAAREGLGKAGKEAADLADEVDLDAAFKQGEADVGLDIPIEVERPRVAPADVASLVDSMARQASDDAERKAGVQARAASLVDDLLNPKKRELDIPVDVVDDAADAAPESGLRGAPGSPERAREIIDRMRSREAQAGGVSVGDADVGPDPVRIKMIRGGGKFTAEAQAAADTILRDKPDLDSLGALEGVKRETVDWLKSDPYFQKYGTVKDNFGASDGGIPQFTIEDGGRVYLSNGRHRFTAARELGLSTIEGRIRRVGKKGGITWDYRGPISVGSDGKAVPVQRGGERGMVDARSLATSPMGNVIAGGTGYAAGGAAGDQEGAIAGGALGLVGSALLGRRAGRLGAKKSMLGSQLGAVVIGDSASNIAQKEAAQVARQADRGVARAERNAVKSQAEDIVNRVTKGESPIKEGGGFMRDSRLAQYHPEIIETATKEMRSDLNELNNLSQGIRERAVKQEDVAKNIADNLPAQRVKARELGIAGRRLAGSIMADARNLAVKMGKRRPQHFSGTSRDLVTSLVDRSKAISKMTDGSEIFNALDDLKRIVDNHKVALEGGSRKSAKDPLAYQNLIPRVEEYANQIRSALEDVPTFGRAGEMQKAYNATYHQKWFPAKRVFEESVFKVTGRDYRAFDTLDAWEGKITSLLKDAGTGERRHVGDMLGALKEMAEQRAKYGTASAKETGRIIELVEKIGRTFELADETTAAARRMQNITTAAGVAAGAAGAVFGGIPGAVISGGIARGAAELATGKYRRAFMNMRGATDDAVNKSVDDWVNVSKARGSANDNGKAARKKLLPRLSDEDKALLKSAKRLGTTFGVAQFLGENDDASAAFQQKRKALQDDEGFMTRFSEEFGDLAQEEPAVYMVAAGKAAEVRKYLVERLPANIAVSMARPNGYPPTNEAVEDWSVYWNAATNPRSVIASMSRGDIRPQEVETLRTLYRPLYESLQATLIDRISRATEMGDDLDDQFVLRMSMLFDLDGAGTPAFSNRAAAVARSMQPQQPAASSKPFAPKAASRVNPSNVAVTGPTYGSLG